MTQSTEPETTESESDDTEQPKTWMDALKLASSKFEDENTDLEARLWGDIGFHSFFIAEGNDPTRGVHTAIHAGFAEMIEEIAVDADIVEQYHGEVTPETVRETALNQIEDHTHLSGRMRETLGDAIEDRIAKNMDGHRPKDHGLDEF